MHAIFNLPLGLRTRSMGMRRLLVQAAKGGGCRMRDHRDVAIVTLLCLAFSCVTILFLKLAEPTGGVIELLFPRVGAEYRPVSGNATCIDTGSPTGRQG